MLKLMRTLLCQLGKITVVLLSIGFLSACVTQNYAEDKPLVKKDYNDDQKARTRISLALGYLQMGNHAQAKYNLEKAKQFSPRLPDVYTAFAHYFEKVGEFEQTENSYNQALSFDQENANTLNNFGVFLCRQNRVDEAETYFMRAIEVDTYVRVAETYENIALCHLKEQNFAKAERALKRSIAHSPNSSSSLLQMAQIQYAKGDYYNSVKYISRFELATRRFTPQAIALAYKANQKLGKTDVANGYATMLLKMFPESSLAKQYLVDQLLTISADDLALSYKKYKLLKLGISTNDKSVAIAKKSANQAVKFKQTQPKIVPVEEKLVVDATIIKQTSQSIAVNSQIANQANVTAAQPNNVAISQPVSSQTVTSQIAPQKNVQGPAIVAQKSLGKPAVINTSKSAPVPVPPADKEQKVHVVMAGENLYQVSRKYNIMISTIRRWNDLKTENIHVGQILRLTKP